jgi:DNA (cytosine-5)-methyltransferase 1
MRERYRILDLFCGAGGCAKGYQDAEFYVVGVDVKAQPNYHGDEFVQDDALHFLENVGCDFDAIHASPPCQDYSAAMRHLSKPQPRLIEPVREALVDLGYPWVIENVAGAPLPRHPDLFGNYGVELCGTSFGLTIRRHRLFESSFHIPALPCRHTAPAMNPHNEPGRQRIYEEFGRDEHPEAPWRREMGVDWMERYEAREAVPPVFTEHIGKALMAYLNAEQVAA